MTLASPFLDILVSLKTSWVGSVLSLIAIQFPWKLFEQSSWCFKCYFLILQYWNWSSWQVTILRPSVINRELYLWATRGLKIFCLDDIHWMQHTCKPYAIQTCFPKPLTLLFKQLSLVYLRCLDRWYTSYAYHLHCANFWNWQSQRELNPCVRFDRPT